MKNRLTPGLWMSLLLLGSGCVTHITTDQLQNPPPAEKFSSFTRFEVTPVTLAPPYAGAEANERALKKIQENITANLAARLPDWNQPPAAGVPPRTLKVEPVVTEIKFINGAARVWAGAFAGSSAVILKVRITEAETGRVIATPIFYARSAAMGGAFSFGVTDNLMLVRIAGRLTDYLAANQPAAVGGPTGAEPPKS